MAVSTQVLKCVPVLLLAAGACAAGAYAAGAYAAGAYAAGAYAAGDEISAAAPVPAPAAVNLAPEKNLCGTRSEPVAIGSVQWNGWGRELDNSRYQPVPAIRAMDVPKLALKWAYGYQGGTEFGQPTLVDGRLFVASSSGRIYALDAKTGCTYWTYDAPAGSPTTSSNG